MDKQKSRSGSFSAWARLWLPAMVVLALIGCASPPAPEPRAEIPPWQEEERRTWEEGIYAFKTGNYNEATVIFEVLSETARTESTGRKALYALACTRLILAQTADEYNEAMSLWDCWSRQNSIYIDREDPRMLTPFLGRITPPIMPETPYPQAAKPVKDMTINNILMYKNLLQAKEKEIDQMKNRLDAREREIKRLRHQIESLEEIHLKFQERKQEVSSP